MKDVKRMSREQQIEILKATKTVDKEVKLLAEILDYTTEDLQELKEECRNNILELRRELKNEFSQECIFEKMEEEQKEKKKLINEVKQLQTKRDTILNKYPDLLKNNRSGKSVMYNSFKTSK